VLTLSLATAFILLNVFAYRHAYAMMNFTKQGQQTKKPEELEFLQKIVVLLLGVTIPKPQNDASPADFGLSFETHRISVANDLQLEAWYVPHPDPKGVILLFHGYAVSKSSLLPEAQAFNELGYTVYLIDFRGSGGSDGYQTSIGYAEADDVAATFDYVRQKWPNQPVILYGQSMGGVAILRAIYAHNLQPEAIIIEAVFDRMLSTVQNRFSTMSIPSFPGANLLVFWGGVQQGYSGFKHNPVAYAAYVQCPTLMLHGTDDSRVTIEQARSIYDNLNGRKQFEEFEGVGHESYLVAQPDQWKRSISEFLVQ
jgi:alpha-beta hydrolase superfamily lysophospholipase